MGRAGHWTEARHARPRPHRVGHLRRQGRRVADHEFAQRQRRARHVLRQRPLRRDLARRRQGDRQAGPRHCRARLSAGSAARLHDAGRGKRQHQTIARHPGEDFRRAASWLDQPGAGVDRAHQRESRRRGPHLARRLARHRPAARQEHEERTHRDDSGERLHRQPCIAFQPDHAVGRLQGHVRLFVSARSAGSPRPDAALPFRRPAAGVRGVRQNSEIFRPVPGCVVRLARRDRALGHRSEHRGRDARASGCLRGMPLHEAAAGALPQPVHDVPDLLRARRRADQGSRH